MSFKTNFISFLFISILGVLLHFTYEWSDYNSVVGLFSAVSESTWEHLKLIFFPMLLLTLIQIFVYDYHLPQNFLTARTLGLLCGMAFIVIAYYTISGVIGKNIDIINIILYFVGVIIALWVENKQYNNPRMSYTAASIIVLLLLTSLFFIFTFYVPEIGLFINNFSSSIYPSKHSI